MNHLIIHENTFVIYFAQFSSIICAENLSPFSEIHCFESRMSLDLTKSILQKINFPTKEQQGL